MLLHIVESRRGQPTALLRPTRIFVREAAWDASTDEWHTSYARVLVATAGGAEGLGNGSNLNFA